MTELEVLAMGADAIDGDVDAAGPGAMIAAAGEAEQFDMGESNVQQVGLMLALAVPLLGKMYPSIERIYTAQAQQQVAASLGPVLSKHGISLHDIASSYGPEIAALLVCVPLAIATVAGVKADILESRPQSTKGDTLKPLPELDLTVLG